jgi:hypothetical protein
MTPNQRDTFDAAARPLMDWLAANIHPHASVIVTSEAAELVEGSGVTEGQRRGRLHDLWVPRKRARYSSLRRCA